MPDILDNLELSPDTRRMIEAGRRRRAQREGRAPDWGQQDVNDSCSEFLLRSWGHSPGPDVHPLTAEMIAASGGDTSLIRLCRAVTGARGTDAQIVASALASDDFRTVLTDASTTFAISRMNRSLGSVLSLTVPVTLPNFLPARYGVAELSNLPDPVEPPQYELRTVGALGVGLSGEPVAVWSAGANLMVSRKSLLSDSADLIRAALVSITSAAARKEAQSLFSLLDGNRQLSDGSPWFDVGFGNLLTATQLDSAGLASAASALRTMPTESGEQLDAAAKFLIVAADDEMNARGLVIDARDSGLDLEVVPSAFLSGSSWYLSADPDLHPVVGRATLAGSDGNSVYFEPKQSPLKVDAVTYNYRHDVGFHALARPGLIRANKS